MFQAFTLGNILAVRDIIYNESFLLSDDVTIIGTSMRFCFGVFVALFFYSVVNPETYLFFATKARRHQEAQKFIFIIGSQQIATPAKADSQ